MKLRSYCFLFLLSLTWDLAWGRSDEEETNTCFSRHEMLETALTGIVQIDWMVDSNLETVTFHFNVKTNENSLAIGVSHFGKLSEIEPVDYIVGGLNEHGEGYLTDMSIKLNVRGEIEILKDQRQDYNLIKASKTGRDLNLSFRRKWDTGDERDIKIDMSLVYILWFDLPEDSLFNVTLTTIVKRLPVYLLDPEYSLGDQEGVKTWAIRRKIAVPPKPTTYWCQVHKFPEKLTAKHHVIGFSTKFSDYEARRHVHHIVIYKCESNITAETEKLLESFVDDEGSECYFPKEKHLPTDNCRTFVYVWGYGGKDFILPKDAGFPIGQNEQEYFIMEIHFDNPRSWQQLEIEIGVDVFYTNLLRENDAGLVMTGYGILPSIVIPPKSKDMMISGQCQPQCTQKLISKEGITVFGVLLHSHTAGRKISLNHFSLNNSNGNNETSLCYDEHYNFQFQAGRHLLKRRKIFPGDHLVTKCSYDTKRKNRTTLGGLSTQEEMCLSFLWYYPKIPEFNGCTSGLSFPKMIKKFGIDKASPKLQGDQWEWVVNEPKKFINRTLIDVLDNEVSWTDELREEVAKMYEDQNLQNGNHC